MLLAVGHEEMQNFIARDNRIESCEIVDNIQGLYEIIRHTKADALVLSKYLGGEDSPKETVDFVRNVKPDIKIIYLYGEEDEGADLFIQFLKSKNIKNFHIGNNISSIDLSRLIFNDNKYDKPSIRHWFKSKSKTTWYRELDTAVITIYSNCSNGKSHFAWNMASAFERHGYTTTLINLDRGYSANVYFGIENIYHDILDYYITKGEYKEIYNSSYKKGNLNVITGGLGNEEGLNCEEFLKLLHVARSKSKIVIIDTYTGFTDTTLHAINHSTIDFLIFDCDLMHFHMNKLMLDKLSEVFIENKTYAIINNCSTGSEAYKDIYRQISKMNIKFKNILPLSTCGSLSYDLMATGKTPFEVANSNSNFCMDMNNIMDALNVRGSKRDIGSILNKGGS